jgi:hypothetical protein
MRCSPRETAPGEETCTTRSTAPMSMPSSSDEVATSPRSWPDLSWSSISSRRSRDSEPWWAMTSSGPASCCPDPVPSAAPAAASARAASSSSPSSPWARRSASRRRSAWSSFSFAASRSASRRALTKMRVERCSRTRSSRRGCIAGQMLRRAGPAAAGPDIADVERTSRRGQLGAELREVLDRDHHLELEGLALPASTMVTGRGPQPPSGRWERSHRGTGRARRGDAASPTARPAAGAGGAPVPPRGRRG